jgi:heterodisulfide reductase subunit D
MLSDMQSTSFEDALSARVQDMLDACTRCGACFAACPITEPAGLAAADPSATVAGVLDVLRLGEGTAEAEKWAKGCTLSGECIKACDYGVNPRFLLVMTRLALTRKASEPAARRKRGIDVFRRLSQDVNVLSQLQLSEEALIRLGQRPAREPPRLELPDVVFYTGCNVLRTPHIALLCLDIMDVLGIDYQVMGGPTHCCGIGQLRAGDVDTLSRFAGNSISKL